MKRSELEGIVPRPRRATIPVTVQTVPATEPLTELERWVRRYAESVAAAEGLTLSPKARAA